MPTNVVSIPTELTAAARTRTLRVLLPAVAVVSILSAQQAPDGLSASDWSSIRAAHDAAHRAVLAVDCGYAAHNPAQQLSVRFDGRGLAVQPDDEDWSWGLELVSYGFPTNECAVAAPVRVTADGQRLTYVWDGTLDEWYENAAQGIEHGYTLHARPIGKGPLQVRLRVRGGLAPAIQAGGRDVAFQGSGGTVLNYAGLHVADADGTTLSAHFTSAANGLLLSIDEGGARYPLTIDPVVQQAYLKASNTDANDFFGSSVAISGDTVVVGAYAEDSRSLGVNGDQTNNLRVDAGAAYVFVRSGAGTWSQQAYLKASNTEARDNFGWSVAVSGDTAVVGAYNEDSNATGVNGNQANNSALQAGAAYVFVRNGSVWSQQAYLKASNTESIDSFGHSVAVSGDTIVVGTWGEGSNATGVNGNQADNSLSQSGAAYVFVRSGSTWTQQAYLKASNTRFNAQFGWSVAVSGDTVLVGSYRESSNATGVDGNQADQSAIEAGAAYVFVRSGGTWSQQAYLKASNTNAGDYFGRAVAVSGDTAVVGAQLEDSSATGVDGNQADNSAADSGAAYVFVRTAGTWAQQAYLKASNTDAFDTFGGSVAVSGDRVLVGAANEQSNATGVNGNQADNSAFQAGAAYVFTRNGGTWSQRSYLKGSNTTLLDSFGRSVAMSDDTLVVGAPDEDSSATGVNGNQADNNAHSSGAVYAVRVLDGSSTITTPSLCASPATLTVSGTLAIGGTIELTVVNATGLPFCGYGFAPAIGLPTPCGCAVLADPTGAALGDFTLGATRTIVIPASPFFVGVQIEVQGVDAFPAAGGCSLAGLSFGLTDIHTVTIG